MWKSGLLSIGGHYTTMPRNGRLHWVSKFMDRSIDYFFLSPVFFFLPYFVDILIKKGYIFVVTFYSNCLVGMNYNTQHRLFQIMVFRTLIIFILCTGTVVHFSMVTGIDPDTSVIYGNVCGICNKYWPTNIHHY